MVASKPPGQRRRRNATPGFKLLPHEGRQGPTPAWPIPEHPDPTLRDLELRKWTLLWSLPQAVEWDRMKCYDDVALYVRLFVEASMPGAQGELITQVRQLDLKIGVSPRAMRDLHWETDEPTDEEPEAPAPKKKRPRIKVDPDA